MAFGYAAGLSAISLLAAFFLAQKSIPKYHSPFPNSNSHHLAKDAASIPNATAELKTENSN